MHQHLLQIINHLFVQENDVRNEAESALNEQLVANPPAVLVALSQLGVDQSSTPELRAITLLLLRTLSIKPNPSTPDSKLPLIQSIDQPSRQHIYHSLLSSLSTESDASTRNRLADTIAGLAKLSLDHNQPWAELGQQLAQLVSHPQPAVRQSVFKIWEHAPELIEKEDPAAVKPVLLGALNDPVSIEVRLAALRGSCSFLQNTTNAVRETSGDLMLAVFHLLHSLPEEQQTEAIQTLIPLSSLYPTLFTPHLTVLIPYLLQLSHPPSPTADDPALEISSDHPAQPAFELLLSLVEVKPAVFRRIAGFPTDAAKVAIECLARLGDDAEWGKVLDEDEDEDEGEGSWSVWGEECLDRLAEALGGKTFLPATWGLVESLCKGEEWKGRYAGLMSIASIAEGTAKVMQPQLSKIMQLVCPMASDPHPRVRFALVHCLGQLCTDFEGHLQSLHPVEILRILLETFHHPLPKVYAHAAAALINFCDGVEDPEVISPYLDDIVQGLLGLLETGSKGVQEQAVTTLATVANAAELNFAKYYGTIMPILLNFLRAPAPEKGDVQGQLLKGKVLECCGLIGLAVGPEMFRQDAVQLAEALKDIQAGITEDDDPQQTYVIMTWGKICEALREEFAPYLPIVMPSLLKSAALSPELSVVNPEEENAEEYGDNWDVVDIGGQSIGIKTSSIEQTAEAFQLLVVYASRLGAHFAPYMEETMNLSLKNLTFFFEDSVRESAAMIIPILMSTAKAGGVITPQLLATVFQKLTDCIASESDAPILAIFFKSFADCVRVVGVENVSVEARAAFEKAAENQLTDMSDRRKLRAERSAEWDEEEKETAYSLEREETQAVDQLTKTVGVFDPSHRLLFMASACKDLGFAPSEDWEDEE